MDPRESIFDRIVFTEAEDDPPDMGAEDPPEVVEEEPAMDDTAGDEPPDMMDDGGDFGDMGDDTGSTDSEEEQTEPVSVSDKISTAMNSMLYQRYLTLLNTLQVQLGTLKDSSDTIYSISPKALSSVASFSKLLENVKLYLADHFLSSNYSKNLFFYNRCLNLLKLLNDGMSRELRRGNTPTP